MATLVFSAVGTALGGPLGGALGALIGNQLDRAVVGSPRREGPRLRELAVTTSSYGTAVARHFGRMRAPGTVIWATDLEETKEKSGGSKGGPSVTTFAYTVSFAVALASRPITDLGRIWADGNLLRGAGGDLKVGGQLRVYQGHGDQIPDPLIASDRGAACPAFRDFAYCVFEDLQLADFGNRIPSLTFEIIADDGEITLAQLTNELGARVIAARPLAELAGFSFEGGPLSANLATIDQLYPMTCDASGDVLRFAAPEDGAPTIRHLPAPTVDVDGDGFGGLSGRTNRRQNDDLDVPDALRYYDVDRDYQPGMQRAGGRARAGRTRVLEFPGALPASRAQQLCRSAVQRANWSSDQLLWRIAELDPSLAPGQIVTVPGHSGSWRIDNWEWTNGGIELDLRRLPPGTIGVSPTDAGTILVSRDAPATPTVLLAFELPWDGTGSASERRVYAAASSSTAGWTGAALYLVDGAALAYVQPSGSRRTIVGHLADAIMPSAALLFDRQMSLNVSLVSDTFALTATTLRGIAEGRNRILVGGEVMQFTSATSLGAGLWQLTGLLRGRGGTEAAAHAGHLAGTPFVLLDERPVLLDTTNPALTAAQAIGAIGLADDEAVIANIANAGLGRKPLTPVHPRTEKQLDGSWLLSWTRRDRGAWTWPDLAENPLSEQTERYLLGLGDIDAPVLEWERSEPRFMIEQNLVSALRAEHQGRRLWVRQVGSAAYSDPLLIVTID